MQAYSRAFECADGDFNCLFLPQYAPSGGGVGGRMTPLRSGNLRLHSALNLDMSINKTTQITERTRVQFRAEAFNATNTNFYGRENFNRDPNSANFGTIFPRDAWNGNRYPRQIQLAVKSIW